MKKNLILIIPISLLLLLLWQSTRPTPKENPPEHTTKSVQTDNVEMIEAEDEDGNPIMIPESALSPELREERRQRRELSEKFAAQWKTPIIFYGKVVDENGRPIEQAQIDYSLTDTSPEGRTMRQMFSDMHGNFTISGVQGYNLIVRVSKEGYLQYQDSRRGFTYGFVGGSRGIHQPDANQPEVFRLHKKAVPVPLVDLIGLIVKYQTNGTPVSIDLYTGLSNQQSAEALSIRIWAETNKETSGKFPWKMELEVPGGGVIDTDKEFILEAPVDGYSPKIIVDMTQPTSPNWRRQVEKKVILRTQNGNYARVELRIIPGGNYLRLTSHLNPDGYGSLYTESGYRIKTQLNQDGSISLIYPKGYEPKRP